ncbi:molybdopterin-dependent oxidoreductase [bacterium]|nr:molybdopterin-dependent oxidoreductase [bacterium]
MKDIRETETSSGDEKGEGISRRDLLTAGGAALVVPFVFTPGGEGAKAAIVPGSGAVGAYIKIDTTNTVTVVIGATEMGQGILTGLSQLVAEELNLNWPQVRAEHAPASTLWPNPYGNPLFGAQLTGGSTSTRGWYAPLRQAAAIARDTLIAAAGKQFGGVWTLGQGGALRKGTSRVLFSSVVVTASGLTPPTTAALATTTRFIGKSMPRLDVPSKTDGSAVFGMDVKVPGMKFGSTIHAPVQGGKVKTMPATSGGARLYNLGTAVGVLADDTWTAIQLARGAASQITWDVPTDPNAADSAALAAHAQQLMTSPTASVFVAEVVGSPRIPPAARSIDVTYSLPFMAHATMEVMNCTANVTPTSCEIWAPTQGQQFIPGLAASITGLPADAVTVHTTLLGGGLGRKFETDYVAEAVNLSKQAGVPVKLIWSREEDFKNDYYRPSALIRVQAAVGSAGLGITNMIYRNVSPSINIQRGTLSGNNPEDTGAVAGAVGLPYRMGARRIEYVPLLPCDVRLGYWRSVGESYNTFAVESAIDELALVAGRDPMEFRKGLVGGTGGSPRSLRVLKALETLTNWSVPPPAGQARGMAFLSGFGSFIAMAADVAQSTAGQMVVKKVYCAIDCGVAVNPGAIETQIQGGIAHGISATLWGGMNFVKGKPQVQNFNHYRMLKLNEMPQVAVTVVPSSFAPGGVGETGVPCVAPALANAWAKLTGTRVRNLPFYPGATMGDG